MSVQSYIREQCHPFAHLRIFREEDAPDLERVRKPPPSAQEISAALIRAGCESAIIWTERGVVGYHKEGDILAQGSPGGWLLTGGPRNLLNYGVPDASALERFPDVLASIQAHARTLNRAGGA
jgi:hypothetical protein